MKRLPIDNPEYIKMLTGFEQFIVAQNYSGGIEGMPTRLREFLFFLETKEINRITDVQTSDILDYYEYLQERPNLNYGGGLSGSTIRTYLESVTKFFEYLVDAGIINHTPCALPRLGPGLFKEIIPPTEEEVEQLYAVAGDKFDHAMLSCTYGCGMRRLELENLNIEDVVFSKKEIAIRKSKFHKSRTVPMTDKIMRSLKDYLANDRPVRERHGKPNNAFFLNRYGTRMDKSSFNDRYQELVRKTGNKKLIAKKTTIHQLRHAIGTHMINRGADADYVRRFLGHTLLDTTTGVYAKRRRQKARLYKLFEKHKSKRYED